MKYLKLFKSFESRLRVFENFDDNKAVIDALKKILACVKSNKPISSVLNASNLIDMHDKCSDEDVMHFLSTASEIAGEEVIGKKGDLSQIDVNKLEATITLLEGNPEKAKPAMKTVESFIKFNESNHNKSIKLTEEESELFSDQPALSELISKGKITLKKGEVLFDKNDKETKEILDVYLEIPGK